MHSFALLVRPVIKLMELPTLAAPGASDPPNRRIWIDTSSTKREAPPSALLMRFIDRRVTKILNRAPFPTASVLPLCNGQTLLPTSITGVRLPRRPALVVVGRSD